MKKFLITSAVACTAIILSLFAFSNTANTTTEGQAAKTIDMQVYAAANYSSAAYNSSNASLHVTVTRLKDSNKEIVWQMDYPALELKAFPENINAFKQQINIPAIFGKTSNLEIDYTLTYNSNGSILQMKNTEVLDASKQNEKLFIEI
ncbi:hypothetical protein BH10BAC2_BH10BAC2_12540 [soil metagenome]